MVILGIVPFFFLSILLQRKVECLSIVKITAIIQEYKSEFNQDLIPVTHLNCKNETLRSYDFVMYPNRTLYVKKYDLFLNSNAYVLKNDNMVICKPSWEMDLRIFIPELYKSEFNQDLIPVTHLNCENETLKSYDYVIYPNRTLYVKKYDLFLISNAYVLKNDNMVICKPSSWERIFIGLRIYFVIAALFLLFLTMCPKKIHSSRNSASGEFKESQSQVSPQSKALSNSNSKEAEKLSLNVYVNFRGDCVPGVARNSGFYGYFAPGILDFPGNQK